MDGIRQEIPNESQILNFNKRFYRQPLNKKLAHILKNLQSLRPSRNKQSIIPKNQVISGKCPLG